MRLVSAQATGHHQPDQKAFRLDKSKLVRDAQGMLRKLWGLDEINLHEQMFGVLGAAEQQAQAYPGLLPTHLKSPIGGSS